MKKLACLTGVMLAYFSVFFSGQINFVHRSGSTYVRLEISIEDTSQFSGTELRKKNTNQSAKSKFELFCKTRAYTIRDLRK